MLKVHLSIIFRVRIVSYLDLDIQIFNSLMLFDQEISNIVTACFHLESQRKGIFTPVGCIDNSVEWYIRTCQEIFLSRKVLVEKFLVLKHSL